MTTKLRKVEVVVSVDGKEYARFGAPVLPSNLDYAVGAMEVQLEDLDVVENYGDDESEIEAELPKEEP